MKQAIGAFAAIFAAWTAFLAIFLGSLRGCSYLEGDHRSRLYDLFNSEAFGLPNWLFWVSIPVTVLLLMLATTAHLASRPRDKVYAWVLGHIFGSWGLTLICGFVAESIDPSIIRMQVIPRASYQTQGLLLVGYGTMYLCSIILAIRNNPQTPVCFSVWTCMILGSMYLARDISIVGAMAIGLCIVATVIILSIVIALFKLPFTHGRNPFPPSN